MNKFNFILITCKYSTLENTYIEILLNFLTKIIVVYS